MNARLLLLHALSPLHAGTGQGVGVIDLPIARERATSLPFVPGSTIKGVLRDNFADDSLQKKIFGPKTDNAEEHAGSAQFADARLLLLPVRSLLGTFAWVTSPYVLRRFLRDLADAGITGVPDLSELPQNEKQCLVSDKAAICDPQGKKVYLEDLDLQSTVDAKSTWASWLGQRIFPSEPAWQTQFAERFCIVHDNLFNFLLETATEVTARIKLLDDAKTVQKGGLWYEESLPTESILSGLVLATPTKKADISTDRIFTELLKFNGKTLQVGGKATVGRGLVRLQFYS
jgi:CRISPR-associated protein Cmr4